MSCYHPLIGFPDGKTASGKTRYRVVSSDGVEHFEDVHNYYPDSILIPCGHCIGCRLDYSRSWADRMMLELETAGKGLFVTLTYNEENIPKSELDENGDPVFYTLDKRDCQLFMKSLRKRFPKVKLRFYLAGEYGPSTLRPHYHAILFGIGLEDIQDLVWRGKNELGHDFYTSDFLAGIWKRGYTIISSVSWRTCAYVGRYVTKKLCGPLSFDYDLRNCVPEFALMSRRPGIGADYLMQHPECLDYVSIDLSAPDGAVKIRIPKYYLKFLQKENLINSKDSAKIVPNPLYDPDRYDKIMSDRKEFANDNMVLKLQKTSLGYLDYLEMEEQKKLNSIKSLNRGKVTL